MALFSYRKRLLKNHMRHSKQFGAVNLDNTKPGPLFDALESAVYGDSIKASSRPDSFEAGRLRMISRRLPSGHLENTFVGSPLSWMKDFMPTRRYVTRINTKFDND